MRMPALSNDLNPDRLCGCHSGSLISLVHASQQIGPNPFRQGVFRRTRTFIRTLKENLLWVQSFDTIEDLRQALLAFRKFYNDTWLIQRHGFITTTAFRQKQLQPAALAA